MEIIRGTANLKKKFNTPVITIGNFDGIHLGHQKILKDVKRRSSELKGDSIVYTFEPHPLNILFPHKKVPLITSFSEKIKLIEESGIDIVICEDFTPEYANLSPRQFVKDILLDKIGVKAVFVGHDYAFGKGRKGNIDTLKQLGKELVFEVHVVDAVKVDAILVSSTKIRDTIQKGDVKKVAGFLGRSYSISGKVEKGKSRGKGLGFPTANLRSVEEICPKPGIYAVHVSYRDQPYQGVVNIGFNPTFKDKTLSIEVYILEFNKDIYDEYIKISFVERLRDEKAFDSPEALVEQIKKDVEMAREILNVDLNP
ncbi:MAG: bifunctional riboflavin kinase/FAD synthetase [Deltaproteobacteria bacterium]|jgi:riboflavin kinase/FMN adenylyltransferase|nr:MAG: bifunctional riboflavin kinase/FAD synthetase [Deltaproteobacteria bacterium]